ncbi:MAG: DUF4282 domain-containing protein [Saccharospirillum sp.]|nr:DUF4282 domain-containing protein [Saccharospirillum sp.]
MNENFATPVLVNIFFWIGTVFLVGGGLYMALVQAAGPGMGIPVILGALFFVLMLRVLCEWILIQFSIHSALLDIKEQLRKNQLSSERGGNSSSLTSNQPETLRKEPSLGSLE